MQLKRFKRLNQGTMVVASVWGGIHLGFLIWNDVESGEQDAIGADIWSTLPELFSFAKIFEESYPLNLVIAMLFMMVNYGAGMQSLIGAVDDANELIDAGRNSPAPALPAA